MKNNTNKQARAKQRCFKKQLKRRKTPTNNKHVRTTNKYDNKQITTNNKQQPTQMKNNNNKQARAKKT